MDIESSLKSEVFRPLVTIIVPGALSLGPFIIVTGHYVPIVRIFWDDHPSAFVAIIVVCVLASGLILENFGAVIETKWDRRIDRIEKDHNINWDKYLKLELKDEIVGQRYLRIKLTWMKFELAMVPALIILWLGLLWVDIIYNVWSFVGFLLISLLSWSLITYMLRAC